MRDSGQHADVTADRDWNKHTDKFVMCVCLRLMEV